jgi:hypothetical protein
LQKWKWGVLQCPPYSPNLGPSDLYVFEPFKKILSGKIFEDQTALQKAVVKYFTFLGKEHYHEI